MQNSLKYVWIVHFHFENLTWVYTYCEKEQTFHDLHYYEIFLKIGDSEGNAVSVNVSWNVESILKYGVSKGNERSSKSYVTGTRLLNTVEFRCNEYQFSSLNNVIWNVKKNYTISSKNIQVNELFYSVKVMRALKWFIV